MTYRSIMTALLLPALGATLLAGCAKERKVRSFVQEYALEKSAFQGTWYYNTTAVEVPHEAFWVTQGEQGVLIGVERIQWVIERDFLYAYRAHDLIRDSEPTERAQTGDSYRGEPVAAFRIDKHFDISRAYNPTTGEEFNVLEENTVDRLWWEREYMRVDWSENLISDFTFIAEKLFYDIEKNPVSFYVADPNHPDSPRFEDNDEDGIYDYIEITGQMTGTPKLIEQFGGFYYQSLGQQLNPAQVTIRHSFMRKKEDSGYVDLDYPDPLFEKFGYFRNERLVNDPERGYTDFLDYKANRFAIWQNEKDCVDTSVLGSHSDAGTVPATHAACEVKPVEFYLNDEAPEWFEAIAAESVRQWNEVFKEVVNELKYGGTKSLDEVEDVILLREIEYTCGPNGDWACQRPGDIRYSWIAYHADRHLSDSLGLGQWNADQETGETLSGTAHYYGGTAETFRSQIRDIYDLLTGTVTDVDIINGETTRDYISNAGGSVFPAVIPQSSFESDQRSAAFNEVVAELRAKADELRPMMQELAHTAPNVSRLRRNALKGTYIEDLMVNREVLAAHGIVEGSPEDELFRQQTSPLRRSIGDLTREELRQQRVMGHSCRLDGSKLYTDHSMTYLVERAIDQGMDREEAIQWIMEGMALAITLHELGHVFGLRHNFEGSFDEEGYHDEYHAIRAMHPDPPVPEGEWTPELYAQWSAERAEAKKARELAGIDLLAYASVMDYGEIFYYSDISGLGKYDKAAIKFGYGLIHEVFDTEPNPTRSNRKNVRWYPGGQRCQASSDCPFDNLGQTCVDAPNNPQADFEFKICSTWESDQNRAGVVFPAHRFCGDERVTDRPFCNRYDSGASALEIVENVMERYEREYIFNNFRRYRYHFGSSYISRIFGRYYMTVGKQLQALLYQLFYRSGFDTEEGAGGIQDMFAASLAGMHFFNRIITAPPIGGYDMIELRDGREMFALQRFEPDGSDDFDLTLATGNKHLWTVYEQGYYGEIFRLARLGTWYDKVLALEALSTRDWGFPSANDETYPINYYDAFAGEMLDLFGGLISDREELFAPLVVRDDRGNSQVKYRDLWSGTFFESLFGVDLVDVFGLRGTGLWDLPPRERYNGSRIIDPGGGTQLRIFASIYSLLDFPVFFDATFGDTMQLQVFSQPEVRYDADDPRFTGDEIVEYVSPITNKAYVATEGLSGNSITAALVRDAAEVKADMEEAIDDGADEDEIEDFRNTLLNRESFMNIVNDVLMLVSGAAL